MPADRIEPPTRSLSDLALNETAFVAFLNVHVDADGATYLDKDAPVGPEPTALSFAVVKRSDGYHLTLSEQPIRFKPSPIRNRAKVVPVIELIGSSHRK